MNGELITVRDDGWFTRERILTALLALVTLLLLYLCCQIAFPFLPALTFAIALGVSTQRPYSWLSRQISNKSVCATIAVILVTILLVIPASLVLTYAVQKGIDGVSTINAAESSASFSKAINSEPHIKKTYSWIVSKGKIEDQFRMVTGTIAAQASALLTGSFSLISQGIVTLFVLFFIYRDGDEAYAVLKKLLPLSEREASAVLSRLNETILATVNGSFIVALVQSVIAAVIYLSLGIPGAILWSTLTFFFALLPVFGTFAVWGPISIYLFVTGETAKGFFLIVFGLGVVGTVDNILFPYLVGDKMRLHTVPIFFAGLGGVIVFGPTGIILGPIILAVTFTLLNVWWLRTTGGKSAESEVTVQNNGPNYESVEKSPQELTTA